jgi:solute carrier family 25 citrate transporter 1
MPEEKKAPAKVGPLLSAAIGGITGAIEISCTYPTEYTKTVMQLYKDKNAMGAVNVIKDTYRTSGFFGLYKGYSALLMFSVPKNYVRFGTYTYVQNNILTEKTKLNNFMCGLSAGAAEALLVVTPQETLKTKLIHDKLSAEPKYRNVFHGIYSIVGQHGAGGIYKGVLATLLKQSTNQGVRFVVFEDSKNTLTNYIPYKVVVDLCSGAFAGFCSTMFNNPVDVVKTKMQGLEASKYTGFADCFKQIYAKQGVWGFYMGVGPRVVRVVMDVALTFAIFHQLKRSVAEFIANRL